MSFNLLAKILILALLSCVAYCQIQFTASLAITKDPAMAAGSLVTVNPIYYDAINQLIRLDYPNLVDASGKKGLTEIYNFKNQTIYQLCNACTVYQNPLPFPNYYQEATDIAAPVSSNRFAFTLNNKLCNVYQKISPQTGGILYVWVTSDAITCRAERTDGTTYDFNNFKSGAPDPSVFIIPPSANCPKLLQCASPIDLVLVLDQSGSIHRDEWAQLVTFATGVVNSFIIGPNNTQIGLVYFSGVQYAPGEDPASCCGLSDPALPLSFDNDTITKFLLNHQQTGGHTCINCGIKSATTYEPNKNRPIQVPKVMLVLTDGYNNRMTDFFAIDIANAKSAGWNMFAIGVGNASLPQLNQIASNPNQVFYITNFGALQTIAQSVIYRLCSAFPTITPCGPLCQGKCGCGQQCLCPQCQAPDLCTTGSCVNGVAGSSCLFTPKFCDPFATNGNLCLQNVCSGTTGNCTVSNKNCSLIAPDSCYTQVCNMSVGCTLQDKCPPIPNQPGTNTPSVCFSRVCLNGVCSVVPKNCTNTNQCATTSCDPVQGCISSPINCDDGNACTLDTCSNNIGCVHTAIQCPPANFFNTTQNNKCLTFTCDPKIGCTSSPNSCNDNNVCTTDSCNPTTGACVNTPIVCPNNNTANLCQSVTCDAVAGCITTQKNCNDNNYCTTDSCTPSTGACVNTPVVCPSNGTNSCTTSICDNNARKCILSPKIICPTQSTNKCLSNVCSNGQCTSSNYQCPITTLCSTSICDPVNGCILQPKICNDNNTCTIDACDATSGNCTFTPIPGCNTTNCTNCVAPNPCQIYTCQNGSCINSPFTCPPNLCTNPVPTVVGVACQCVPSPNPVVCTGTATGCGTPECNPLTGTCGFVNTRVCDDKDPCTVGTCSVVNGNATCSYTQISCPGDSACSRKKCVVVNNQPVCVNDTANTINCTSNGCASGQCNPATGTCQFTLIPCPNASNATCQQNICNPVTQQCQANVALNCPVNDPAGCGTGGVCVFQNNVQSCKYNPVCQPSDNGCISSTCVFTNGVSVCKNTTFSCDDQNVCTTDQCVPNGVDDNGNPKSKCVNTAIACPASTNPCSLNVCANVNGKPVCQATAVVCNATSLCIQGSCQVQGGVGVCVYNETKCGTADNCTNFVCNQTKGCQKINRCDDGNPCTNDLCDLKTGKCTFVQKVCNATSLCTKGVCNPNVGCVSQPIDCALDRNVTALDACHFAVCTNITGCTIAVVPNSLDACGYCNQPGKCAVNRSSKIPAGAIAGAVIGGAVIAGILALGIGLFAAKSGAAAFTPGTQVQMSGGSNNPLYTDGDNGGTNPFDDNDYVPL